MNDYFQPLQTGMGDTLPPEGTGPVKTAMGSFFADQLGLNSSRGMAHWPLGCVSATGIMISCGISSGCGAREILSVVSGL
jgi:hypothetical protein